MMCQYPLNRWSGIVKSFTTWCFLLLNFPIAHVLRTHVSRANDKVIHVENHGTHSPMYNDLKEEIQRYSNWLMLRTLIRT